MLVQDKSVISIKLTDFTVFSPIVVDEDAIFIEIDDLMTALAYSPAKSRISTKESVLNKGDYKWMWWRADGRKYSRVMWIHSVKFYLRDLNAPQSAIDWAIHIGDTIYCAEFSPDEEVENEISEQASPLKRKDVYSEYSEEDDEDEDDSIARKKHKVQKETSLLQRTESNFIRFGEFTEKGKEEDEEEDLDVSEESYAMEELENEEILPSTIMIVTPENRQAILEYTSLMIAAGTQMLSILPLQANNQRIPITVDIWNRYEILKRMDMCKQGATENVLIQRLPETNSIVRISDRLSVLGFCAATSTERKLIGQLAVTNHIIAYGKRPFKVSVWVGGEQKERMHYSIKTQHCIDDAITQFYSKIDEE